MNVTILDENGQEINQLVTLQDAKISPLLLAFFERAYNHDNEFKSIIDNLIKDVVDCVAEIQKGKGDDSIASP